eukprot:6619884-Lingulodinium_polyedra.AAC.1
MVSGRSRLTSSWAQNTASKRPAWACTWGAGATPNWSTNRWRRPLRLAPCTNLKWLRGAVSVPPPSRWPN